VLRPDLTDEVLAAARQMFDARTEADDPSARCRELEAVERQQTRLADAIAAGGDVPVLVARLRDTEERRRALSTRQAAPRRSWREVERRIRESLMTWRALLTGTSRTRGKVSSNC
jgi:hypothetical protein